MKYINFSQLRSFHAVSKTGSITQASKLLNVSQPTITKQIQLLEQYYSINLINRHARGISLTDLGNKLYEITFHDSNLSIVRDEIINLFNNNFETAKKYITQKIAYSGFKTPAITIKATETDASLDNTNEKLSAALSAVTSLRAQVGSGKQDFNIILSDGSVMSMAFTTRTNKVGAMHKLGQFQNLAVKFNKIS